MSHSLSKLTKKLPAFRAFLADRGAEVLEPTNEWEVVRFRAAGATSVIYKNGAGRITPSGPSAKAAMDAFFSGQGWSAGVAKQRTQRRSTDVRALLARDGDRCFLCSFPMDDDLTVEHLVPLSNGGPNHLSNMALTHARCNHILGSKSLMEKIRLREHHQNWSAEQ